jgi:hypothetical protein
VEPGNPAVGLDPAVRNQVGVGETLPPRADAMMESLRSVGYDLETAVADIIDNSVSAGARKIDIWFEWAGANSWVRITDNGHGMSDSELREAMRLGGRSPLEERSPEDLGRFGLGLKTASFSQCRRLTVISRLSGLDTHVRCWDFEVVQAWRDWILLDRIQPSSDPTAVAEPPLTGGTVVLWELLDRIVPNPEAGGAHDHFLERVDDTYKHLAMVFHRYLTGRGAIRMTLNGRRVEPWDPFLSAHSATQVLPETALGDGASEVAIKPYVLPHESKLSQEEHREASGPRGWNAQQGFYVYRNRRLIVPGSWLGMYQQEEHTKLARIQLDIQNALDQTWHVDVRKATAVPPAIIRRQLQQIAQKTRQTARKVYGHRGAVLSKRLEGSITHVWEERNVPDSGHTYRINRRHPLIKDALDSKTSRPAVSAAMRLIEETIPVNLITARFSEQSLDQDAPFQRSEAEIISMMDRLATKLCEAMAPEQIREMLLKLEPFAHYPDLVAAGRFCVEADQ